MQMASRALAVKNAMINDLKERLARVTRADEATCHAVSASNAVAAAETQLALARCRELELRLCSAAAEQQRAVQAAAQLARSEEQAAGRARLEAERLAAADAQREVAAELERQRKVTASTRQALTAAREQRAAVKGQVAALQAQISEARNAHSQATATLAQLDPDFAELRQENEELRLLVTQRESAYLTLLETVQEVFQRNSPAARTAYASVGSSPAKLEGALDAAVFSQLQEKLVGWQRRLQGAAKLRSEGTAASTADVTSTGFGSRQSVEGDGASCHSPAGSVGFMPAHASQVQAAIEAAASEATSSSSDASSGTSAGCVPQDSEAVTPCSSSSTLAGYSDVQLHDTPASPCTAAGPAAQAAALAASPPSTQGGSQQAASRPATGPLAWPAPPAQQQQQQQKVWRDNPVAAVRPVSRQGSRIKELGLQAAGSPVAAAAAVEAEATATEAKSALGPSPRGPVTTPPGAGKGAPLAGTSRRPSPSPAAAVRSASCRR